MNYFEQINAMHQQVREFVEQQEPACKVVSVAGQTATKYTPTMASRYEIHPTHAEFVLVDMQIRFHVEAYYLADRRRCLTCTVYVTSDGKLLLKDHVVSI